MIQRYLAEAEAAAARALAAAGGIDREFSIAGLSARFRFCGPALVPTLTRAMTHLSRTANDGEPDVTLTLWDSRSTGVDMPPPPWSTDDYIRRGEIRDFHDGVRYVAFSVRGTILMLFNAETRRGLYWTRDPEGLPVYERAAPCRAQLGWWLASRGRQPLHAGAVGDASGCVLLAGRSGSGKSSTAIDALVSGLTYLSDDYCVLGAETSPVIYSLYTTGKMLEDGLARMPVLAPWVSNPQRAGDDKIVFFFHEHMPERIAQAAPLKAVLIPRIVASGDTGISRASATDALLALAPSTTSLMPYAGGEVLRNVTRAVKAVPAFHLTLGPGGPPPSDAIRSVLASLR